MKPNVGRGSGFRGLLSYLLDEDGAPRPGAEVVGGNLDEALDAPWARATGKVCDHRQTINRLVQEFSPGRRLQPTAVKPVWHCSLSLPAGERLTDERWNAVGHDMLSEIGLDPDRHPYVIVRHADTAHDHVHIVADRVSLAGRLWHGKFEARAVQDACRALEKRHGLKATYSEDEDGKPIREGRRAESKRERLRRERTGEEAARMIIQNEIDRLVASRGIMLPVFIKRLAEREIDVRLNQSASTGRISGISFCLDGESFAGRHLGKGYSWPGLQKRGVECGAGPGDEPVEVWEGLLEMPAKMSSLEPGGRDRRQAYKVLLLSEHYRSTVSEQLAAKILRVDLAGDHPTVVLIDRSKVTDFGERITTNWATLASVQMMFDLAAAKGWSSVRIEGSDPVFIRLAIAEASRRGVLIENREEFGFIPSPDPQPVDDRGPEGKSEGADLEGCEEIVDLVELEEIEEIEGILDQDEDYDDFAPR